MTEHSGAVTFQGNPLTLVGDLPEIGDTAPDFSVLANDLSEVTPADSDGRIRIISTVPSLDTPVCDIQTRRFNEEAASLGDVSILTISMDLPFAQARWCGAAGVSAVQTLSDHRDASFGSAFGVLIKELRLLARAAFVVDPQRKIRYTQLVKEITQEPDYAEVLGAVAELKGA